MGNCTYTDDWVRYFAYGGNLAESKIRKVLGKYPEAVVVCLRGYRIAINKKSRNWHYAANIQRQSVGTVWGVAYRCDESDLDELDDCEKGYHRTWVTVRRPTGLRLRAITYVADHPVCDPEEAPKTEYVDLILKGAKEHNLPRQVSVHTAADRNPHGSQTVSDPSSQYHRPQPSDGSLSNMELGITVTGGGLPEQVERYFDRMVETGALVAV